MSYFELFACVCYNMKHFQPADKSGTAATLDCAAGAKSNEHSCANVKHNASCPAGKMLEGLHTSGAKHIYNIRYKSCAFPKELYM